MGDKPTHPTKQSIDNKDEQAKKTAKKTAKKQGEQLSEEDLDKVSGGHLGIRR